MFEKKTDIEPWIIWGSAAFFAMFIFALQTSVSVMISPLKADFKINDFQIGFLSSSFFYTYAFAQIPIGGLIDKFGTRRILAISALGIVISCFFFSISDSYASALTARILMGLFAASAYPCAFCLAAVWFPSKLFTTVVGFTEMLGMLGAVFIADSLSKFVDFAGWRDSWYLLTAISLILTIIVFYCVKDAIKKNKPKIKRSKPASLNKKIRVMLFSKTVWLYGIYAGLIFAPLCAFAGLWGIPFVMRKYSLTVSGAGWYVMLIFLGTALGSLCIGKISELFHNNAKLLYFGSTTSLILSLIIIYIQIPLFIFSILMFVFGLVSSVYILPFGEVKKVTPNGLKGTTLALTNAICGGLGTIILQPLIGYILHILASDSQLWAYQIALTVIPGSLVLSLLFLHMIKKNNQKYRHHLN